MSTQTYISGSVLKYALKKVSDRIIALTKTVRASEFTETAATVSKETSGGTCTGTLSISSLTDGSMYTVEVKNVGSKTAPVKLALVMDEMVAAATPGTRFGMDISFSTTAYVVSVGFGSHCTIRRDATTLTGNTIERVNVLFEVMKAGDSKILVPLGTMGVSLYNGTTSVPCAGVIGKNGNATFYSATSLVND